MQAHTAAPAMSTTDVALAPELEDPPTEPSAILRVAQRAIAFLRRRADTDVDLEEVERATGCAWQATRWQSNNRLAVDPLLTMRLKGQVDVALERFLRQLATTVAALPDAACGVGSNSDASSACAELWADLREPLMHWTDRGAFARHAGAVCERIAAKHVEVARAQLLEQLTGMRAVARACDGHPLPPAMLMACIQDEALLRTVAVPCGLLRRELRRAAVPLEELAACLESDVDASVRGPAALPPCLAAKQLGLEQWLEAFAKRAAPALAAAIAAARQLAVAPSDSDAWNGLAVVEAAAAAAGDWRLPDAMGLCAIEGLRLRPQQRRRRDETDAFAPMNAVRIAATFAQLAARGALAPRRHRAEAVLALLARTVAEARAYGAEAEAESENAGEFEEEDRGLDDFSSREGDSSSEEGGNGEGDTNGGSVPPSPMINTTAVAAATQIGAPLVRMPPGGEALNSPVPTALQREHAVFSAVQALLEELHRSNNDRARMRIRDVAACATMRRASASAAGFSIGRTTVAALQNASAVLRKLLVGVHAFAEAHQQPLQPSDLICEDDHSTTPPCRCVSSSARGREWALVYLRVCFVRIATDPLFAKEWHGTRSGKSKARRRALKTAHASAAALALRE